MEVFMSQGIDVSDNLPGLPSQPAVRPNLEKLIAAVTARDEDQVFDYTRRIRMKEVERIMEDNGGNLPADPKEAKLVLDMLKDLDSQAAKIKAVGAKEKSTAVDREANLIAKTLLDKLGTNMFRVDDQSAAASTGQPPSIDQADLPPLELVPDETKVGVSTDTYQSVFGEEN